MSDELVRGAKYENIQVEEADIGFDLDALLGDTIEDSVSDTGNSLYEVEDNEVMEFPHFKIPTKKFLEMLKISGVVSQGSGRDVVSKAIGMEVSEGKLNIYLTDFEIFVNRSVDILNSENVLTDLVVVNLPIISKVINTCPKVFTVFKKEDKYYIKVKGGVLDLETLKVPKEQFIGKENEKLKKVGVLPTKEFCESIKRLYVLASSAVVPAQRRVFIKGNEISAMFLYCSAKYTSNTEMPEMDLAIKNIKIIYALAASCGKEELIVLRNKNRVVIQGDDFSFNFKLSEFKPQQIVIDSMNNIINLEYVNVDATHLNSFAKLSADLVYSTTRMEFNYTVDGNVGFKMKTKRNDGDIVLQGEPNPNAIPLEKSVGIQSNLLTSLLGVFSQTPSLKMFISSQGIGICSGGYAGVLYTE